MFKYPCILALILTTVTSYSQTELPIYSKIKIDLTSTTIEKVGALGLEADHGHHAHSKHLINFYNQDELYLLDAAGIPYEVILPDAQAFYREHGSMDESVLSLENRSGDCGSQTGGYEYTTPENYASGSMGGYLPYAEVIKNLDLMKELFPELITERLAIDSIQTHQGRFIYHLVISSTPGMIDPDKPQILYDALHHAREPNSVSQILFYMWYLLENYGKDEEVTFLVENTTMFFIPMVNPDGYVYNELTNPNGGGLWRKNRYPNANGDTVGVDLNRNYGYFWAYDDEGSSNEEASQTYRGPSAFSEPETQAVRKLCMDNNFQLSLNYHTFGNLLIHPWGYEDGPTAEDSIFKSLGNVMITENDFLVGTGTETVGYTVNGDSDDWMYGELIDKNKIYAMTPEVGPGFWPGENSIDQLNKSAMRHNLNAAHLLLSYGWLNETFAINTLTDSGLLFFEFEKSGLKDELVDISIISETPGFTLTDNLYPGLDMSIGEKLNITIGYEVDAGFSDTEINFVAIIDYGTFTQRLPFSKTYISSEDLPDYSELDSLNDLTNFELDGDWNLTTEDFFSAPSCITDSPGRNYRRNESSELLISRVFNAEDAEEIFVKFYTKFEIEQDYDYVQFLVSADDDPYVEVCGELTSDSVNQFSDTRPVYQGDTDWARESICLNDFIGATELRFKFVFFSDGGVQEDGFYFDDFTYEVSGDDFTSTSSLSLATISIRPNPSTEKVTVQVTRTDFDKGMAYEIHNMKGQTTNRGLIHVPQQDIDISGLDNGSYIITIIKENKIIGQTQFVKN